jgi:uncharacterized membrane protein YqaE (UPF0057 family)
MVVESLPSRFIGCLLREGVCTVVAVLLFGDYKYYLSLSFFLASFSNFLLLVFGFSLGQIHALFDL